jgi:hypothetical protein
VSSQSKCEDRSTCWSLKTLYLWYCLAGAWYCRYSLEIRVAPGCAEDAAQLVAGCCPAAMRRPEHWQAQGQGQEESAAAAPGAGASTHGAGSTHLSFAIPQGDAELPELFAALEAGRWGRGACTCTCACRQRSIHRLPQDLLVSRLSTDRHVCGQLSARTRCHCRRCCAGRGRGCRSTHSAKRRWSRSSWLWRRAAAKGGSKIDEDGQLPAAAPCLALCAAPLPRSPLA